MVHWWIPRISPQETATAISRIWSVERVTQWENLCTPETFPGRVLSLTLMHEIPCDTLDPDSDSRARCRNDAPAVSQYAGSLNLGLWCVIGPDSDATWEYDKFDGLNLRPYGAWDDRQEKMRIRPSSFHRHVGSQHRRLAQSNRQKPNIHFTCCA